MKKKANERMTPAFVKEADSGRHGDGGRGSYGLTLLVKNRKGGGRSKSWSQRLVIDGRVRTFGLGSANRVSLSEAREQAAKNALRLRALTTGGKSSFERALDAAGLTQPQPQPRTIYATDAMPQALLDQKERADMPTFEEMAVETFDLRSQDWTGKKTLEMYHLHMANYILPVLGAMPIDQVGPQDILKVLAPVWIAKPETARKLKVRMSAVLQYAVSKELRKDDPTSIAMVGLPKHRQAVKHHSAAPWAEVPGIFAYINSARSDPAKRLCLQMLILTGVRTSEALAAMWSEIDLEGLVWTIPAERMKTGKAHRVPLSRQAVDVLKQAAKLRRGKSGSALVFEDKRGGKIQRDGMRSLLRRHADATTHGLRSSFRDWAAEETDFPREIIEFALAHVEGSASELAYRRTDYFCKRGELMQQWGDFVSPSVV